MLTLLVTVLFLGALMAIMAIGVVVSGRRLQGSCGGIPGGSNCSCSPDRQKACAEKAERAAVAGAKPSYDDGAHHLDMHD